MIRKYICIAAAFMLSLSFTGCGKGKTKEKNSVQSSTAESGREVGISKINICGKELDFPFEYGELGKEFTLKNALYFSSEDYTLYDLYKGEVLICRLEIQGKETKNNKHGRVININAYGAQMDFFKFNGIRGDAEYNESVEKLGKADNESENYLEYSQDNVILSLLFDKDTKKLDSVILLEKR